MGAHFWADPMLSVMHIASFSTHTGPTAHPGFDPGVRAPLITERFGLRVAKLPQPGNDRHSRSLNSSTESMSLRAQRISTSQSRSLSS
jgi:hypothetical protein